MSRLSDLMVQVKKLKNGKGIQSLLDAAYAILGNPLVMFNTEYSLLAHTEAATDDPLWNEIVTHGTFLAETQRLFGSEGFIEDVANASRVALMTSGKLKYDRMNGKIFNKNNAYVANAVIVACNKRFEEGDMIVFEAICKLISKEISGNAFYQEYEQSHQEVVVKNLIDGTYDIQFDMAQVEIIYGSLESNLYAAVADLSQCNAERADPVYFRDLFMRTAPAHKYAIYSGYIVVIVSTDHETLNVKQELKALVKLCEQNHIYIGISSRFENLFELQKYYREALKMVQYVSESKNAGWIFPYDAKSIGKMKQIEALENGLGLQYFLNKGPEFFGNPLLFHDMELNLLAYTEDVEISDPIWEELITYGTSSDETINLFKTEGFIHTMESTKGGALLTSKKIKYDRMSWRIYSNDNIMIGCLSIVNSIKPFAEDDLVLFGAFSRKFSKEVGKIEFYNHYGQVYSKTVINRLISGKIDDYTFYSEDIGNLYDHLMDNIYLVVVDTTQCSSGQISLTCFRDMFNRSDTLNRYSIYSGYIIVIVSTDNVSFGRDNMFHEINALFEQNNIYAGISECFVNIYDLQKHYIEAVEALTSGMKSGDRDKKQRIFQYRAVSGPDLQLGESVN